MTESKPNRRVAAAVLLLRGRGADLEVFLVERAPELRFFGGYVALPGGVRGPEDGPDDAGGGDATALWSCAVREMLEETGVLLDGGLRRQLGRDEKVAWRERLLRDGGSADWVELRERADRDDAPRPVCRICTPPFAPVRYDTVFFAAELPSGEVPDVRTGELTGGRFWRPAAALDAWRRGDVLIVPPVVLLLELLSGADLETFARRARSTADSYAAGRLHRVRFSPGVAMASVRTPTLPPATTTNCLLVGTDRLWIVDPATPYPDEQERLFALIDELREDGSEPTGILVSHHHVDHVGAVTETSRRYGLPVRAHALTLERLAPGFHPGEPLEHGDAIELGTAPDGTPGWQLLACHTPGHDKGHVCFRETRYDAVFVGDMLSTVSTIVIDPPEGHMRTYLRSLEGLLDAPMGTLYPAHGPAMRDGHRLVRQYFRHRLQREAALHKALLEGPTTAHDLVAKVYWETDPRMYGLAERSLVAGLEKLEEDGRATRDGDVWRAVEA